MSEEEIKMLKYLEFKINISDDFTRADFDLKIIKNVLNLIEKQQKEIEKLKARKFMLNVETGEVKEIPIDDNYISKDKIRWRPISEYDTKKYDWVLVKYYDGDFECVPAVAEQRNRKWFSRDDIEIPFEVKYFFDMQELLGE